MKINKLRGREWFLGCCGHVRTGLHSEFVLRLACFDPTSIRMIVYDPRGKAVKWFVICLNEKDLKFPNRSGNWKESRIE